MALRVDAAHPLINGAASPPLPPAQAELLYDELLRLRDAIVAGQRPELQLPSSVVDHLKARIAASQAPTPSAEYPRINGTVNGTAYSTNATQLPQSYSFPTSTGLPGLGASPIIPKTWQALSANPPKPVGLDPIFLEKAPSLVRAEAKLKRERLDRELQAQGEQRKPATRYKDQGADAPSQLDVDAVLNKVHLLVTAVSGLKAVDVTSSSSFDENDYYSSQVQSDWSSQASSKHGSDRAAGAFTADYERLDGGSKPAATRSRPTINYGETAAAVSTRVISNAYADEDDDMYEPEDGDDDYAPPDASFIDTSLVPIEAAAPGQPGGREDDDSDYEPGEVTQESQWSSPKGATYAPYQPLPLPVQVPVIRNHLTHIAAPQPNRVSPLATAKGQSYELELVNGSPQVVKKGQQYPTYVPPSRASTASPSGNGNGARRKKTKKRKRDQEGPTGRAKRRRGPPTRT